MKWKNQKNIKDQFQTQAGAHLAPEGLLSQKMGITAHPAAIWVGLLMINILRVEMPSYYAKQENKIYRFDCWSDLEVLSGKDRLCYGRKSLSKAIRQYLGNCRTIGKWAAKLEGWIDDNNQPTIGYTKGNSAWT